MLDFIASLKIIFNVTSDMFKKVKTFYIDSLPKILSCLNKEVSLSYANGPELHSENNL